MSAPVRSWALGVAPLVDGWTGQATLTIGGDSIVAEPHGDLAGPLQVWLELHRAAVDQWPADTWEVGATAAGLLWIANRSGTAFALTFTGTTGTKLGFTTGPWSGAEHYTADVAHPEGLYLPAQDVELDGAPDATEQARTTANASAVVATRPGAPQATIRAAVTHASAWAIEAAAPSAQPADVWWGGRYLGRWHLESMVRRRLERGQGSVLLEWSGVAA